MKNNIVNGTRAARRKPDLVIQHLQRHGRITEGHALIEYGRFSVAHAVWCLRHTHQHLIPEGKAIKTRINRDVNGQRYAEWELADAA